MSDRPKIAIVGPGKVGGALGARLAGAGYSVCFGVREGKDIGELLARCGPSATSAPPAEAAQGSEIVILAVPGPVTLEVAGSLGDLGGKIVVDCNNPVRWDEGPVWSPPPEGSLSAAIAKASPKARVVKAFNTFGAEFHADPGLGGGGVDVQIASDDADAKKVVASLAEAAGFEPVDVGPLRNAAVIENLAVLWIHLATVGGQGRDFAFKKVSR